MMNKNMPSENMNLDEKRKHKMLLCNNEDTEQVQPCSTTMINLHQKNRMNISGTSENTDLRKLQAMLILSLMQKEKERARA